MGLLNNWGIQLIIAIFVGVQAGNFMGVNMPVMLPIVTGAAVIATLAMASVAFGYEPNWLKKIISLFVPSHAAASSSSSSSAVAGASGGQAAPIVTRDPLIINADEVYYYQEEFLIGQMPVIESTHDALQKSSAIPQRTRPVLSAIIGGLDGHGKTTYTEALAHGLYQNSPINIRPNTYNEDFDAALVALSTDPRRVVCFNEFDQLVATKPGIVSIVKSMLDRQFFEITKYCIDMSDACVVLIMSEKTLGKEIAEIAKNNSQKEQLSLRRKMIAETIGNNQAYSELVKIVDFADGFTEISDADFCKGTGKSIMRVAEKLGMSNNWVLQEENSNIATIDLVEAILSECELSKNRTPKAATSIIERLLPNAIAEWISSPQGMGHDVATTPLLIDGSWNEETRDLVITVSSDTNSLNSYREKVLKEMSGDDHEQSEPEGQEDNPENAGAEDRKTSGKPPNATVDDNQDNVFDNNDDINK